ncbi:MAG: isoprenylcysteine carboxylmethyltransferase family protein [Pseudomonadota bacterium]
MNLLIPPPVVGLLTAGVIWSLDRWVPLGDVQLAGQRALAIACIVIGLAIDVVSIVAFFRARTTVSPLQPANTQTLVVTGCYRFSRNPMYLGMLCVLIGWVLWLGTPLGLLALVGFVAWITVFQIKPEERALADKFAEHYREYCQRVRRWL